MSVVRALKRAVGRCETARAHRDTAPHTLRYVSLRKGSDVRRVKADEVTAQAVTKQVEPRL